MSFFSPNYENMKLQPSFLLALCLVIIWGAIIYYIYALNWLGIILTLFLSASSYLIWRRKIKLSDVVPIKNKTGWIIVKQYYWLIAGYLFIYAIMIALLISARSDQALISPWEVVSPLFFYLYGAELLLLAYILTRQKIGGYWKLSLVSLHYLVSLSLTAIVYTIGYGFDPFIHVATVDLIIEKGLVLPKPPYYLGQYSLIVIIAKISGLAAETIDRFLVPVLASLLLPFAFLRNTSENSQSDQDNQVKWLALIFLPILTFSPFVFTTPQNLSYIFLILTVLFGSSKAGLKYTFILAAATTAIHPLTGLPALSWFSFLVWQRYRNRLSRKTSQVTGLLLFLTAALALPLTLAMAARASFNFNLLQYFINLKKYFFNFNSFGQENVFLNTSYFFGGNIKLLLFITITAAVLYSYRKVRDFNSLLAINSALLVSYLISLGLQFDSLINYEQQGYASRIPVIIIIFFLPIILFAGQALIAKIKREPKNRQLAWLGLGILLATISLYLSYPRFDKYWNSRGYSTGAVDIMAVREIANDAKQPYVALANQQVSAAALKELGFDNYHLTTEGEIYTYPIPTGGPLYKYYLDMVYQGPKRETAKQAASLAGVKSSYLVVNKYWYQSGQIINAAKLVADKWWDIEGKVYIFQFEF